MGYINRALGIVRVREDKDIIYIEGITETDIYKTIRKLWNKRIADNFFIELNWRYVSFYKFFALDIYYMFKEILRDSDNPNTPSLLIPLRKFQLAVKQLEEYTWISNLDKDIHILNFNKLKELNYEPLDFQMEFLKYYDTTIPRLGLKGALLSATAGSGKTYTSLALSNCLESERVIIICPKNAIYRVWEDNIQNVFKSKQNYWIADKKYSYKNEKFLIFHYETLELAKTICEDFNKYKTAVLLDESHNLNEITSNRTNIYLDLLSIVKPNDTIHLSGTPIKAMGGETVPLFKAIDPLFTEDAMESYKNIFSTNASVGYDIINNRLGYTSFTVSKDELKLDKPIITILNLTTPDGNEYTLKSISEKCKVFIKERKDYYNTNFKTFEETYYNLVKKYYNEVVSKGSKRDIKEYNKYIDNVKDIISAYQKNRLYSVMEKMAEASSYENKILSYLKLDDKKAFREAKSVVKYVSLKIQGECLGRVIGGSRIDCSRSLSKVIDYKSIMNSTLKKTVIFTSYTDIVRCTDRLLRSNKFKPIIVYGETKDLKSAISIFEKDDEVDPLIATYASLSTAVPLVMADTMIMLDQPFRSYIQEQAISRIHRLGSDSVTKIFIITLDTGEEPNISSRTIDILKWSQEQVSLLLGMKTPYELNDDGIKVINNACNDAIPFKNILSIFNFNSININNW